MRGERQRCQAVAGPDQLDTSDARCGLTVDRRELRQRGRKRDELVAEREHDRFAAAHLAADVAVLGALIGGVGAEADIPRLARHVAHQRHKQLWGPGKVGILGSKLGRAASAHYLDRARRHCHADRDLPRRVPGPRRGGRLRRVRCASGEGELDSDECDAAAGGHAIS